MFLAHDLQISGVYVSLHAHGLFVPSKLSIRARKIALREVTLKMRWTYAMARLQGHTPDSEAVTTLEDVARIARRVFGGAHPMTVGVDQALRASRAALAARETAA